jgi:molybdopterin-synthase adenylyltransferase
VVGQQSVTGVCDFPVERRTLSRIIAVGIPTQTMLHEPVRSTEVDDDLDRQLLAIGARGQAALRASTIAVVGLSGGGSHVAQQLIHAGVGTLVAIDFDRIDERNLRRVVGAVRSDVDVTKKVAIPVRLAQAIRPDVSVRAIDDEFPSTRTIEALAEADLIVGCVDSWGVREALNDFALQCRIPYIDVGATVVPASAEHDMQVGGQIALVAPDGPCLRCMGLVTDARVEASRRLRHGYVHDTDEPQVVSINGTLASEAVTTAMMLVAGDGRLARCRRYVYPPGRLQVVGVDRRDDCRACREARLIP